MSEAAMTTWDGKAVSREEPHGASIIVYRRIEERVELLILHRAHAAEPNGDWAWTPPSGARHPGEEPDACAARELLEETRLTLPVRHIPGENASWYLYAAQASQHDGVVLDAEHDLYQWTSIENAIQKCRPEQVRGGIRFVVDQLGLHHR